MPIPSEVPTSFVPRIPVSSTKSTTAQFDFLKIILFFSLGIFITALLVSGGIFLYQRSLEGQLVQKQIQLQKIEKTLNQSNVYSFVYLRDQLSSAQILLDKHLTLSRVFNLLEKLTVKKLSYINLKINIPKGKPATLEVEGVAANFAVLAAQAASLKKNKLLTNTVFSGFSLKRNGTVGFTLNATLSNTIVQNFSAVVSVASSTPATLATTTPLLLNRASSTPLNTNTP